jgi:glycosyltransferase involved in cell wall biosynthesis
MNNPFFSIVIPTFQSEKSIQETLNSICNQQFTDFEVIIIDGLSTDDTLKLIKENYSIDNRISYISEKDNGIYDAMNKGVKIANGEWIFFLGSDDFLYDKDVLKNVFHIAQQTTCNFLYGNVCITPLNNIYGDEFSIEKLLVRNIPHQAIFYHKTVFSHIGMFDIRYKTHADWDFNFKCFNSKGIVIQYISLVISYFRIGGASSWHDEEFLRNSLLSFYVGLGKTHYCWLSNIHRFDVFWRHIRNAGYYKLTYSECGEIFAFRNSAAIRLLVSFQKNIPERLLKMGATSKIFMIIAYSWYMVFSKKSQ